MKNKILAFILIIIFSCQFTTANAASVRQLSVDDLLETAELVFEGEATNVESRFNPERTAINTYVTFQVIDIIQGSHPASSIELSFAGGSAENLTMQVHGMIYPQAGETGIYFIEEVEKTFVNPIVGWDQGHFLIQKDSNGQSIMLTVGRKLVMAMDVNDKAAAEKFSNGVAVGLRTTQNVSDNDDAMTKEKFKQALKDKSTQKSAH